MRGTGGAYSGMTGSHGGCVHYPRPPLGRGWAQPVNGCEERTRGGAGTRGDPVTGAGHTAPTEGNGICRDRWAPRVPPNGLRDELDDQGEGEDADRHEQRPPTPGNVPEAHADVGTRRDDELDTHHP